MGMGPMATEKQVKYIHYLLGKLGYPYINAECRHRFGMTLREAQGGWTMAEASRLIERLKRESDSV